LDKIGGAKAVDALIIVLTDTGGSWFLRNTAAWALSEMGNLAATNLLIEALNDKEGPVKQ
jgi:HEAT repeat protein